MGRDQLGCSLIYPVRFMVFQGLREPSLRSRVKAHSLNFQAGNEWKLKGGSHLGVMQLFSVTELDNDASLIYHSRVMSIESNVRYTTHNHIITLKLIKASAPKHMDPEVVNL